MKRHLTTRAGTFKVACLLDPLDTVGRHAMVRHALMHQWTVRDFTEAPSAAEEVWIWHPDGVVAHEHMFMKAVPYQPTRKRIPVVLMGAATSHESLPRVVPDLFHACRTIVRHFAEQQLKNMWMVACAPAQGDAAVRARAWNLAARAERVAADVLYYGDLGGVRRNGIPLGHVGAHPGLAELAPSLIRHWLTQGKGVALYAPDFFDAVELLRVCLANGIAVPGQVAIATDTDHPEDGLYTPISMTCLAYDWNRLAGGAMDLLQRMMQGERVTSGPHALVVDRLVARRSTEASELEHPLLNPHLRFIREHCSDPLMTPGHVADQFRISLRTLQYQFRKNLNLGIAEVIMGYRVGRARASLENAVKRVPLAQVAEVAGFSDVRQMRRAFLRATGREPSIFRRGLRQVETLR